MTEHKPAGKSNREVMLDHQSALADFGDRALQSFDLASILEAACVLVCRGLNVPIARVMEVLPGGQELLLRAAVGLPPDIATPGETRVPVGNGSAADYALQTNHPVISEVKAGSRFKEASLPATLGVRQTMQVVIQAAGEPYGILAVDSLDEGRQFSEDDIDFLRTFAHLVATAVERQKFSAVVQKLADDRQTLLRELQHRVKNDLQVVASMIVLEMQAAGTAAERTRLQRLESRVESLGLVHTQLFASGQVGRVELGGYLGSLCADRFRIHQPQSGSPITLDLELEEVEVEHDKAVPIGLAVNEFLTNSFKHAFPAGAGTIRVSLVRQAPDRVRLTLADNGVGITPERRQQAGGMGLRLTQMFAGQVGGHVAWSGGPGLGTTLTLTFPA